MTALLDSPPLAFDLRSELEAHAPGSPTGEATRLLVASPHDGELLHTRLAALPEMLEPGDLLVVNTSGTLPAAVDAGSVDGVAVRVHLSTPVPEGAAGEWLVELRAVDGAASQPFRGGSPGLVLSLPGGGEALLRGRWPPMVGAARLPDQAVGAPKRLAPPRPPGSGSRLWAAELTLPGGRDAYLATHGRPIRYGSGTPAWPLAAAQTVFAREPGSAEAPSAALGFTPLLAARLASAGIGIAPLVLHTGVASLEDDEPPYPEWFRVPRATAERVNATRASGHRVIAVGTTVTRALETVAACDGSVHGGEGWTDLVVTPARGVRAVDGLLTGWHEPRASHLQLLEAVAGRQLLESSYAAALATGYRWHTFGDLHLVLP